MPRDARPEVHGASTGTLAVAFAVAAVREALRPPLWSTSAEVARSPVFWQIINVKREYIIVYRQIVVDEGAPGS
jgi:hypothetical protein